MCTLRSAPYVLFSARLHSEKCFLLKAVHHKETKKLKTYFFIHLEMGLLSLLKSLRAKEPKDCRILLLG